MAAPVLLPELLQKIEEEFSSLSRQRKEIAAHIRKDPNRAAIERISEIAAACQVQPSAVVRFAQHFGFSGFSEMQEVLRAGYVEKQRVPPNYQQRVRELIAARHGKLATTDLVREFIHASRAGLDETDQGIDDEAMETAVTLLQEADNIYVVGAGRSFPAASYLAYALQQTGKWIQLISDAGGMGEEQARSVRAGDVLVAISFSPYAVETVDCVAAAHDKGARLLIITDSKLSPLAGHADALLTVREGSVFAFRSLTSTICMEQALLAALAVRLGLGGAMTGDESAPDQAPGPAFDGQPE